MAHFQQQPLKIAILSVHSNPVGELGTENTGGMSVYIRELARELGRAGHRVDIYTCMGGGSRTHDLVLYENVRLIYLGIEGTGQIPKQRLHAYLPRLFHALESYRIMKNMRYDLVHSHYWLSGLVGQRAKNHWRIPHVLTFHTTGMMKRVSCSQEHEPSRRLIAEKKLMDGCTRILASTSRERESLSRFYGVPGEKIGLVPCGVNLQKFRMMDRDSARKQIGIQDNRPVILYVGRFTPVKGLDRLLAAAAHLGHIQNLSVMIVGGDGRHTRYAAALRRFSRRTGMNGAVTLEGRVDHEDLPVYYNAADVLVVPSYYESYGLVALEALACGTPVVATDVGAMDTIIHEGKTGAVVKTPSPLLLSKTIETFISPGFRSAPGRKEIRESVAGLGWVSVAARTMREYEGVIQAASCNRKKQRLVS
jgi:D-inositol-3-phosphate glycosyltransferase